MRKLLKDSEHLLRLVGVFAAGLILFLIIRHAIVPKGFGEFGHYRGPALDDIAARPISFAGHTTCEACHDDQAKTKAAGKHAGLACETCHGPAAAHTEDPTEHAVMKPDPKVLCVRCHEADPARPKSFPQVVSKDHAGDTSCIECHQPHSPLP
jgi:predicted CXXCH cytochrome family protein